MNEQIEAALKLIEEQLAAIRAALGGQQEQNPMVTPEKPAEASGGGSMRDFLSR